MKYLMPNIKYQISNERKVLRIGYLKLDIGHLIFSSGQALITLLFFIIFAMTITSGAVVVLFSDSLNATRFQQGSIVYEIAQSGAENAILRLLRDPSYSGETLPVGTGSAEIQVTDHGGGSYTILSKGTLNNFMRKIQVDVIYEDEKLTEVSRKEVY